MIVRRQCLTIPVWDAVNPSMETCGQLPCCPHPYQDGQALPLREVDSEREKFEEKP